MYVIFKRTLSTRALGICLRSYFLGEEDEQIKGFVHPMWTADVGCQQGWHSLPGCSSKDTFTIQQTVRILSGIAYHLTRLPLTLRGPLQTLCTTVLVRFRLSGVKRPRPTAQQRVLPSRFKPAYFSPVGGERASARAPAASSARVLYGKMNQENSKICE